MLVRSKCSFDFIDEDIYPNPQLKTGELTRTVKQIFRVKNSAFQQFAPDWIKETNHFKEAVRDGLITIVAS